MKLLALCDAPTLTSGFARVAANLLRRWSAEAEIDVWGVGFVGWGYERAPYVKRMLPAGPDWATPQKLQLFLAQLKTGGYTHLWMMQDTFLLSQEGFPAGLRGVCQSKGIHSTLYFPVDARLDPEWTDIIAAVDCAIAYTAYGASQASRAGKQRGHEIHCEVLPHGVDTNVYRPLGDRAELRKKLWTQEWVGPDDFLIINVNANQRRKDVTRSLEVLRALRQHDVPAKLLMHMPESSAAGLSLMTVGEQLGLEPVKDWGHSEPYFRRDNALLGEEDLARFYNVADLYLTTSLGEGWGLGITEALACGCPAAVPLHTACGELVEELGAMVNGGIGGTRLLGLPIEKHGVVCDMDNSRVRYRVEVEEAARLIANYYGGYEWKERPEFPQMAEQWLSWDRIAAKMLRLMKRREGAQPLPALYLEYGGGLGDVLDQCFYRGSYNYLARLKPGQRAKVAIISHNPFVPELFQWHPKRGQIEVVNCGYWHGQEANIQGRRRYKLPPEGALNRLPDAPAPDDVRFYPSPEDEKVLSEIFPDAQPETRRVIVLALTAGLPDRTIPLELAAPLADQLTLAGYRLVLTGRTYERHGRQEVRFTAAPVPGVIDAVDRLSVPGVCALVQASAGLVTAHSALNLLAWHLRKPQVLLYPRSAWERHIRKPDQWAFGIGYPETVHGCFEDLTEGRVRELGHRFLDLLGGTHNEVAARAGATGGQ